MLEQNVWNYTRFKFKLQSCLFLPKSTTSLTIVGGAISSDQEGMVQNSYFCHRQNY